MKIHYARSARTVFSGPPLLSFVTITIVAGNPAVLTGQCPGAPTTYPNGVVEGPVAPSGQRARESAVAIDGQGRFIICWNKPPAAFGDNELRVLRFNPDGTCNGDPKVISGDGGADAVAAGLPSPTMLANGSAVVSWIGRRGTAQADYRRILVSAFDYDDDPSTWPVIQPPMDNDRDDLSLSAARSPSGGSFFGWGAKQMEPTDPYNGILYALNPDAALGPLVDCNPDAATEGGDFCFLDVWQPCVGANEDYFFLTWANAEFPDVENSPFDIYLQIFTSSGATVGNPVLVNVPGSEPTNSRQESPAIAVNGGRIVVVWVGDELSGCSSGRARRIFGRLYFWDAENGILSGPPIFKVDGGVSDSEPANGLHANPTVAFTNSTAPLLEGAFFICWNGGPSSAYDQIYGQYFSPNALPMGQAIRVNQEGGDTTERRIEESTQHTTAYGPGQVVVTWRKYTAIPSVHFTLLPAGFAEATCAEAVCLKGDCDNNSLINGRDIQPFTDALLYGFVPAGACTNEVVFDLCRFDMNLDCLLTIEDVPCFVDTLLEVACNGSPPPPVIEDCNSNGISDAIDLSTGASEDCNNNEIPDECEPDCDSDGLIDVCAIALGAADCNGNGTPDTCESAWNDCNSNGAPDDCDLDPSQPGGAASEDCNSNGYPDECDLTVPPGFGGSLDCNTNGIPDECDIAACESDPACDDCNENGIPDSCDIATEISEDANTNGIPDECEGEGLMGGWGGGGESMMSGGGEGEGESAWDESAAWEEFYDWSAAQFWGPACETSGAEQFAALVAKLKELGLPVTGRPMGP